MAVFYGYATCPCKTRSLRQGPLAHGAGNVTVISGKFEGRMRRGIVMAVMLLTSGNAYAQETPRDGNCGPPRVYIPSGFEGATELFVTVSPEGRVTDATVTQSSGIAALDDAAVTRVKNCYRYRPQIENGQPVEAHTKLRIVWK